MEKMVYNTVGIIGDAETAQDILRLLSWMKANRTLSSPEIVQKERGSSDEEVPKNFVSAVVRSYGIHHTSRERNGSVQCSCSRG